MKPKIIVNKKLIQDADQLPDNLKSILADSDNNGMPDIADNALKIAGKGGGFTQMFLNINGKNYKGLSNLSPEMQEKIKQKMASFAQFADNNPQMKAALTGLLNSGILKANPNHPTVTVTPKPIKAAEDDKSSSLANALNNNQPKNDPNLIRSQPTINSQNQQYFQSGPLNPLGRSGSIISPAKNTGVGKIFGVAVGLIIAWGVYELNKRGLLDQFLNAL